MSRLVERVRRGDSDFLTICDVPDTRVASLALIAVQMGHINVLDRLLQRRPTCLDDHRPAITEAAKMGHVHMLKWLISKGFDVNVTDRKGLAPLHYATLYGYQKCVDILVKSGSDINKSSFYGFTPLQLTIDKNQPEICRLLIDMGADMNHKSSNGMTALHWAAKFDRYEIAEILLHAGAHVDLIAGSGGPPLFTAILHNHVHIVILLLNYGAETIHRYGTKLKSALGYARHLGRLKCYRILKQANTKN